MRVHQQRRHAQTNTIGNQAAPTGGNRFTQAVQKFKGQPYKWGGGHGKQTGVQPVDCSGLVTQAAKMAGVKVEGRARDMQKMGQPVSMNNLKPGDLVFRGNPAHHVGIYMGNGQVMHAPRRGQPVQYSSVSKFTSARRIPGLSNAAASPSGAQPRQHTQPIARESYHRAPSRTTRLELPVWPSQRESGR